MEPRIPASEQTHQRLEALLKEGMADGDARTELFRLAVRKIVEEALEAEVSDVLGRGYYVAIAEAGPVDRRVHPPMVGPAAEVAVNQQSKRAQWPDATPGQAKPPKADPV